MINDSERREIAARLRFTDHNLTWIEGCFCIAEDVGASPTGNEHDDVLDFAHALADLIDRPTARIDVNEHGRAYCTNCGCDDWCLADGSHFCPNCGKEVAE